MEQCIGMNGFIFHDMENIVLGPEEAYQLWELKSTHFLRKIPPRIYERHNL